MVEAWFAIAALMLAAFVVLDGWDFGAGALTLLVARTDAERRAVLRAIGPLWSWNEVWLVAAGGVLFVAFPRALAVGFAGTYLALFLVLWSLILRGVSIEARNQLADPLWRAFWDFTLMVSSALLMILCGAALGNVVRGFPLDVSGEFSLPFFTDFGVRGQVGLLDWYTVSVGVFAAVSLSAHGATYLVWRTEGVLRERGLKSGRILWLATFVLLPILTVETWVVRPELFPSMAPRPVAWVGVALTCGGVVGLLVGDRARRELLAFVGSCAFLAGLLIAAAAAVFPDLLHSTLDGAHSITAYSAASSDHSLGLALIWWPVALVLSLAYALFIARQFRGKVTVTEAAEGYY
jgi:cytochrome bd ubiquinol oxidase subunit II